MLKFKLGILMSGLTYNNQIKDVDKWWEEDTVENEEEAGIKIYDLITYPSDFTISTIFEKLNSGTIVIPPFQRNYVWDVKQASKLIESLIIGLPVPQMFFFEEEDKSLIIDGQQRLLSIFYFMNGRIPKANKRASLRKKIIEMGSINNELLDSNEFFSDFKLKIKGNEELDGLTYEGLEKYQEKFKSRPVRIMHIKQIAPNEQDKESSMFEIFDRLNTGGANLSDQEIRMNIHYSAFYKMIDEMNINTEWRKVLGKDELDLRFKDFEILLRCLALADDFESYKSVMKTFLNDYSKKAKQFTKDKIEKLKESFEVFLHNYDKNDNDLFTKSSFQIGTLEAVFYNWYQSYKEGNTIEISSDTVKKIKNEISEYQKSNRSTTSKDSLESRFQIAKKWINE